GVRAKFSLQRRVAAFAAPRACAAAPPNKSNIMMLGSALAVVGRRLHCTGAVGVALDEVVNIRQPISDCAGADADEGQQGLTAEAGRNQHGGAHAHPLCSRLFGDKKCSDVIIAALVVGHGETPSVPARSVARARTASTHILWKTTSTHILWKTTSCFS